MMRVSDYIAHYLVDKHITHVFGMTGGAIIPLFDALSRTSITTVFTHHEQAAATAAQLYAKTTEGTGVVCVTTGPGGTNALTGVVGCWIDSIPCLVISGQVKRANLLGDFPLRQRGVQEVDIVRIVQSVTKYAEIVQDPRRINYHLDKAWFLAHSGRPGPVWLDVPLDVMSAVIDPHRLVPFVLPESTVDSDMDKKFAQCIALLKKAKRPVVIAGYGVRLAHAADELRAFIDKTRIPLVTSWTASDMVETDHPAYAGRIGMFGQRAGHFAVANADLLLIIGCRLSVPHTGHLYEAFARQAIKIMVDIDPAEFDKGMIPIDMGIQSDAGVFLRWLLRQKLSLRIDNWRRRCRQWKREYHTVLPEYYRQKRYVNSYVFTELLSQELRSGDVVVTDDATSFTGTFQAISIKRGQRVVTSSGLSEMGCGLPGAVGASFARGKKRVICLCGDGAIQLNIHELQTVIHHRLPVKLFLFNNDGYLAIRITQDTWFNRRYVGASRAGGVSMPDMIKVGKAYGFKTFRIRNHRRLRFTIRAVLKTPGPVLCELMMDPKQLLAPSLGYESLPDGNRLPKPLEDMDPPLERAEFLRNMLIPPYRP